MVVDIRIDSTARRTIKIVILVVVITGTLTEWIDGGV